MKSGQRAAGAELRVGEERRGVLAGEGPQAGEASAMTSVLTAVVHQMSQPLTALRGTLELALLKATSVRDHRTSEEKALAAAEQLVKILQGVREIAEASTPVAEPAPVDLLELVGEVVEDLRPVTESSAVALVLGAAAGVTVLGDRQRLYVALFKIIHFAVMRSGPRAGVRVALVMEGEEARIAVEDEGPHFPEGNGGGRLDWGGLETVPLAEATELIWELAAAARMMESSGGVLTTENLAPRGGRILVRLPLWARE